MKVLVCGTNYGATYFRALLNSTDVVLSGILSTGSERSKSYAQHARIAHYTNVDDIPEGAIDLACVAIPGEVGQEIAHALLERGIHVLCEHPIGAKEVKASLEKAKKHNCVFQVNAHFSDLYAPQAFYKALSVAQQGSSCLHYDLSVNLRTLYSGLDLIGRALGSLEDVTIQETKAADGFFVNLNLSSPNTSISILCQNFASASDDGSATLLNHRVSATFLHGNLLLAETNGPILWFPTPVSMPADTWQSYLPVDMTPVRQDQLMQQRDHANLLRVKAMVAEIRGETVTKEQSESYLLALASLWEKVLNMLQPSLHEEA